MEIHDSADMTSIKKSTTKESKQTKTKNFWGGFEKTRSFWNDSTKSRFKSFENFLP